MCEEVESSQGDLFEIWNRLPMYEPTLIANTLRRYQKMIISGPYKTCKTTLAIQLAIAVAEGAYWLEEKCSQGKVLFLNFDSSSNMLFSRFFEIYQALEIDPNNLDNIIIENLKGKSLPGQGIADFYKYLGTLISKQSYRLVIIDSIDYLFNIFDVNIAIQLNCMLDNFMKQSGTCLVVTSTLKEGQDSNLNCLIDSLARVIPTIKKNNIRYRLAVNSKSFKMESEKIIEFEYPIVKKVGLYNQGIQTINTLKREKSNKDFILAFDKLSPNGDALPVMEMANYLGITRESVYRKVKNHDNFQINIGSIERNHN